MGQSIPKLLMEAKIVPSGEGGWTVAFRAQLPVERWNAQLSLLCGMAAADLMLAGAVHARLKCAIAAIAHLTSEESFHLRFQRRAALARWYGGDAP